MPKTRKSQKPSFDLSREEQALLTGLLENIGTLDPVVLAKRIPGPQAATALLESLPLHEAATPRVLNEIRKAFPQKSVQKAAKKTAYRLRQRGVEVGGHEEPPAFAVPKEEPSAYVGPFEGTGTRPILLVIPQGASGVDLAMGAVHDVQGIVEFIFGRYSRKRMKEVKDLFFSKVPRLVETTLPHAATVLENAYRREERKPGQAAGEYLRLRPWLLEKVALLDRPPIEGHIALDSVTPDILTPTQLDRLLQHELMISWVVDPERLKPLAEEIAKAEESPIFISEAQRREHITKLIEEGIGKLLNDQDRAVFRRRLEETAYIFFRIGDENLAKLCLAAALSLDAPSLGTSRFLTALVHRTLAQVPKTARSSPLILP